MLVIKFWYSQGVSFHEETWTIFHEKKNFLNSKLRPNAGCRTGLPGVGNHPEGIYLTRNCLGLKVGKWKKTKKVTISEMVFWSLSFLSLSHFFM